MPSSDSTPEITIELRTDRAPGYAAVVSLSGEHDLATSTHLVALLSPLAGDVLVDLSACEFVDSTVIGVLIGKASELTRDGHRLELVVPPTNTTVTRMVDVVGLRTLMSVHDSMPASALELGSTASDIAPAI